jgi:hypothetical protein
MNLCSATLIIKQISINKTNVESVNEIRDILENKRFISNQTSSYMIYGNKSILLFHL